VKVNVIVTPDFERNAKSLLKKYKSLKNELLELINILSSMPEYGKFLGKDCYKIRLSVKSKGKGKSGGLRIITNVIIRLETNVATKVVKLLTIYDKSEFDSITDSDLIKIIRNNINNF